MSSSLPDLLDPWRAVDNRAVFAGRLALSSLPRLQPVLCQAAGDVLYRLTFFRDDEQRPLLSCEVSATLTLRCQRCLEAVDYRVAASAALALVSAVEEARQLPERFDPLLVGEKPIRLRDLVEDELLLALPQIATHEPDLCAMPASNRQGLQPTVRSVSPFAELAELRRKP